MKFQTNEELGPFINLWGCFFCSILEKVEKSTGWTQHFSNENVVGIYVESMRRGWITKEEWNGTIPKDGCFVLNAPAVYNYAAQALESHLRCKGYRKTDKLYIPRAGEEEILELGRTGYNGSHFVDGTGAAHVPDWNKEIEFDPVEGGSQCAKVGFIKSKRILTVEVGIKWANYLFLSECAYSAHSVLSVSSNGSNPFVMQLSRQSIRREK